MKKEVREFVKIPCDKETIFRIRQYAEQYGMRVIKVAKEDAVIVYYSDALNLYWLGANIAMPAFQTGISKHR